MKHFQTITFAFALLCTTTFARAQNEVATPISPPTPTPTPVVAPAPQVITQSSPLKFADFVSSEGTFVFIASSVALPLFDGEPRNTQRSLRTADALIASALITDGLKKLVRAKRPDSDERNSFPSGHATAAFAAATMMSEYQPKQKLLWYGGATLIAWSRVKKRRHFWHDVVAGAAVGHLTARWELNSSRGLVLRPFIKTRRDSDSDSNQKMGMSLGGSF